MEGDEDGGVAATVRWAKGVSEGRKDPKAPAAAMCLVRVRARVGVRVTVRVRVRVRVTYCQMM